MCFYSFLYFLKKIFLYCQLEKRGHLGIDMKTKTERVLPILDDISFP